MTRTTLLASGATLAIGIAAGALLAQQQPQGPQPFFVGNRLGLPINPAADGAFEAISSNVKVYGAIYSAESCSYDADRGRHRRAEPRRAAERPDQQRLGVVHQSRRVGAHRALDRRAEPRQQRASLTPPLVLNEPYGSDIANGMLYLADRDGGTTADRAARRRHSPVQHADRRARRRESASRSRRGSTTSRSPTTARSTRRRPASAAQNPDPTTWQVWKITPDGTASIFIQGAPLRQPNGVAFDPQGNIVVVNIGNDEVLTFSPDGKLLKTETRRAGGQRRPGDHAGRNEVREQRA